MAQTKSCTLTIAVLLAVSWTVLAGVSSVFSQTPHARIAVLTPGLTFSPVHEGLKEGLARLGYQEGKNITFIMEDTKGSSVDLASRSAKLLAAKPDVLFPVTTTHSVAAKQATATVPIVFAWVGNPVEAALIAAYASSKNNVTGISSFNAPLSGKRLETLLEVAPKIKRVLTIVTPAESIALSTMIFLTETAKKVGVQLVRRDVASGEALEQVLRDMPRGSVDAIYYVPSILMLGKLDSLIKKAKEARIPLVVPDEFMVKQGALCSFGPNPQMVGRQAAPLVDRVLKGVKPSDIVIETPNKLFLTVNLATAREIGLTIPRGILERADRLIE